MGYGDVLLGQILRIKLIDDRTDRWRTRLRDEHGLTTEELDTLAPYIEYVSHYGSWKEFAVLVVLLSPFVLAILGITLFSLGTGLVTSGAILTGNAREALFYAGGVMGVSALFGVVLLGAIGYVLWRRWRRYRLATNIREHLTTEPRRLCGGDDPLSKSREEIAHVVDHSVG